MPSDIVHVGPDPSNPGGMAAVIRTLLDSPPGPEYRLSVITTWRSRAPLRRIVRFVGSLASLARWCQRPGPRLAHIHAAVRGSIQRKAICVVLARSLGRPVLLHIHAGPGDIAAFAEEIGFGRRLLLRRALGTASRVVAVSEASAAAMTEAFCLETVEVVPNPPPATRTRTRGATGNRYLELLYLGGFRNPVKGADILLAALPSINSAVPDAVLTAGGSGEPPDELVELLGERLRWEGWLPAEEARIASGRADVFVLPSRSEGLPMALLEAMAGGCAIVATRVGGVPEVLTDGQDALIVPPEDPEALAEAVIRLAGDLALRDRLGSAAAARAARLADADVGKRLKDIYSELLDAA